MINTIKSERKLYQKLKYNRYQKKVIIFETITGWAFLSPLLIVAIIFSTSAIAIALWLTFYQGSWGDLEFVGLANWKRVFTDSSLNLKPALKNTIFFAVISVPITIFIALVVSGILNSRFIKKKEIFLAIFFLPQVTSAIAVTLIFQQLFSLHGIFKMDYFKNPKLIIWTVIFSSVWGGVAGSLITMNTAFATIDKYQYEAADLDGASGLKKFLNITIPSISPVVAYALFMGVIGGLGIFDGPYLLANSINIPTASLSTLIMKGYDFIIPMGTGAKLTNIGLGTTILFMTAVMIGMFTFVTNLLIPISRKTY